MYIIWGIVAITLLAFVMLCALLGSKGALNYLVSLNKKLEVRRCTNASTKP